MEFQYQDLDLKLRCTKCSLHVGISNWYCPCDNRWFLCPTHHCVQETLDPSVDCIQSIQPPAISSLRRTPAKPKKRVTFDQLLEEDLRRADAQSLRTQQAMVQFDLSLASAELSALIIDPLRERRMDRLV